MAGLKALLGDNLTGKDGKEVSVESLADCDLVGIYFSAHWCPPCRGFTPVLAECYNKLKASGKKFEVVFVSSDRDQSGFDEYYNEMPWLTIGFSNKEKKEELGGKYDVSGIPCLVLVNGSGELVTKDGRSKVASDTDGANFPWTA